MELWEKNLSTAFDLLSTPLGLAGLVLLLVLSAFATSQRVAYAILFILLVLSLATSPATPRRAGYTYYPIAQPFEAFRQNSRVVTTIALLGLLVPSVARRSVGLVPTLGVAAFLLFHALFLGQAIVREGEALKRSLLLLTVILIYIVMTGLPLRHRDDWYRSWKLVAYALVIFILINLCLVLMGSTGLFASKRFQGFTANPQATAQVMALSLVVLVAGLTDARFRRALRMPKWALIPLIGTAAGFIAWTGSRTGAIVAVFGLALLLRRRLGMALVYAIPAIFVGYLFINQVANRSTDDRDVQFAVTRLLDTTNTRHGAWSELSREFMSSPLFGRGGEMEASFTESSFLLVGARIGLVGLVPLVAACVLVILEAMRAARAGAYLGKSHTAVQLPLATVGMILLSALAEGYLIGQFQISVALIFLVSVTGRAFERLPDTAEETLPLWDTAEPLLPSHSYS